MNTQPASPPRSATVVDLAALPPTPCPCGESRRAFLEEGAGAFSLHLVEIAVDSRRHYHKRQTEVYYVLSGEGTLEIEGKVHTLRPGLAVHIPPGVRHRAVPKPGVTLKILNYVLPRFDAADEFED